MLRIKASAAAVLIGLAALAAAAIRPLTIVCPADATVQAAPGAMTALVSYPAATTTGGAGRVVVTYSQGSGTDFPVGATPVTVTATDKTGALVSCGFAVTVIATPCTFAISPASANLPASGGIVSVTVTAASASCTWSAVSNSPLLTVSASGGIGSGTVTISAAPNTGSTVATGTVTIGGQTFSVAQAAPAAAAAATLTASSTSVTAGQSVTLTLTTPTWDYHLVKIDGTLMQVVQGQCTAMGCLFQLVVTPTVTTTYQASAEQPNGSPYPNMPSVTVSVTAPAPTPAPTPAPAPTGTDPTAWPIITSMAQLKLLGGFKLPSGNYGTLAGTDSFTLAGDNGLAFNPDGNGGAGSLYITGAFNVVSTSAPWVAEVSIPTPVLSSDLSALNTATVLQPFADVSEGSAATITSSSYSANRVGGLLVDGGKLYFNYYIYYDANGAQTVSHFSRPLSFAQSGQVQGPFASATTFLMSSAGQAGYVAGAMASIPSAWQSLLKGTALTGQGMMPIISRTSFGPGTFIWSPSTLGPNFPVQPAEYYPQQYAALGIGDQSSTPSTAFNLVDSAHGLVFPTGTRSLLFFGVHGDSQNCYGGGVATYPPDPRVIALASGTNASTSADGLTVTLPNVDTSQLTGAAGHLWLTAQSTPTYQQFGANGSHLDWPGVSQVVGYSNPGQANASVTVAQAFAGGLMNQSFQVGEVNCFDPVNGSKGQHAYPYERYVWSYDANDVAAVVAGAKQPWDVRPAATFPVDLGPFNGGMAATAYDPATQRLFLLVMGGNPISVYTALSIVLVYQVTP